MDLQDLPHLDALLDSLLSLSASVKTSPQLVERVLTLQPGTLLELDGAADQPVDLRLNGKLIGRGEIVTAGQSLGVKVTEVFHHQ